MKSLSFSIAMMLAGVTMGNAATVWSYDKPTGNDVQPVRWDQPYVQPSGTTASLTTTTEGYKQFTTDLNIDTDDYAASGFSVVWKSSGTIDLSSYSGLCMTYKADRPFRVDFKQPSITDYNYHGYILEAQADFAPQFIDFKNIAQEPGWGETIALDLTQQQGVQINYKEGIVLELPESDTERTKNVVTISAISLGACPVPVESSSSAEVSSSSVESSSSAAPPVSSSVESSSSAVPPVSSSIESSSSAVPPLSSSVESSSSTVPPVSSSSVESSSSAGPSVNNPPVAADIEYEVNEDEDLIVPILRGIKTFCSDPDGDDFVVVAPTDDSTKYGDLSSVDNMGSFTYTPNKNFHGDDTFTYRLVEKVDHTMISATGTVTIHVKPVNDAPVAKVVDSTFIKDTLVFDMDFDEDLVPQIKIPAKALTFSDVEVTEGSQTLSYGAKGGKKIKAELDSLNKSYYFISVKSVTGASGVTPITVFATDGTDTTGVDFYVKLVSPTDVAQAVADEYTAFVDSTLSVSAEEGVLANDKYPEGVTKGMKAKLAQKPTHGTVTLYKDGSFDYTPKAGYKGTDYFGYYCVINETESKVAVVTISVETPNSLPTVVVKPATLDTTVTEDFPATKPIKFTKATVESWFKDPEGDPLTYSAESKDGKLKVKITDKGILEINSAPDSTGKAYVVVTAKDKKSGSKSFEFCVTIKPVNDKPALVHADTAYVSKSGWTVKWDLDTLVVDVDGDELTFSPNETSALSKLVTISMKGSVITVKANSGVKFKDDQKINVGVKVSDPDKANVTIPLYIIVGEKPAGLMPQLAQPKNTWQNAVMARRGSVTMMDMQGRVIWKAKLPANPAEVLSASAKVQGRKILRVNTQTWTIK